MIIEIKIPSPGESITEVEVSSWLVEDGDYVEKDQEIAEIESDKATLPLIAEESGKISIKVEAGTSISVGAVACTIDSSSEGSAGNNGQPAKTQKAAVKEPEVAVKDKQSANSGDEAEKTDHLASKSKKEDTGAENSVADGSDEDTNVSRQSETPSNKEVEGDTSATDKVKVSPLAKKLMDKEGLTVEDIINGLKRISRDHVELVVSGNDRSAGVGKPGGIPDRSTERNKMSMLRRKLSQRLVSVKNETAMLTTFNEVDMSNIMAVRKKYQSAFTEKHGVKLGFMSFFTMAVTETLKLFPNVNSFIDGEEVVTPNYCDIGIAVQTDKGLMVPVIRNTETLSLADIERNILDLAGKARKNRISIEDMTGGTFTITNGGIFGSLLSTPILNPPQSGILGMHNIVERPVAIDGKVEIRPMMYIALSYDHRIIDGRDSVSFLVRVKEIIENPVRMLFGGKDPEEKLLGL